MKRKLPIAVCALLILISGLCELAFAKKNKLNKQHKAPVKEGQTIEPSRLTPVFDPKADCIGISSPYGSTTRYDGSRRPDFRYNGRHGGIDLSLDPGTPLLAVASGTLVHKAEGGQMEGFYLWLLHTPEDTGYPGYVLTKYQHLNAMPELNTGAAIAAGQVIGFSGATGTYGGHYGSKGYPHLHLSTMESPSGQYMIKDGALLTKARLFDPLLLFSPGQTSGEVKIAFKDCAGTIHPKGSKVVWPVNCYLKLPGN
jgi:murein DD-endopeptidase MepM/ murein hydrolase activator NlpD